MEDINRVTLVIAEAGAGRWSHQLFAAFGVNELKYKSVRAVGMPTLNWWLLQCDTFDGRYERMLLRVGFK